MFKNDICQPCEFYQKEIEKIDQSMEELREASKIFINEANYDDMCR